MKPVGADTSAVEETARDEPTQTVDGSPLEEGRGQDPPDTAPRGDAGVDVEEVSDDPFVDLADDQAQVPDPVKELVEVPLVNSNKSDRWRKVGEAYIILHNKSRSRLCSPPEKRAQTHPCQRVPETDSSSTLDSCHQL